MTLVILSLILIAPSSPWGLQPMADLVFGRYCGRHLVLWLYYIAYCWPIGSAANQRHGWRSSPRPQLRSHSLAAHLTECPAAPSPDSINCIFGVHYPRRAELLDCLNRPCFARSSLRLTVALCFSVTGCGPALFTSAHVKMIAKDSFPSFRAWVALYCAAMQYLHVRSGGLLFLPRPPGCSTSMRRYSRW